MPLNIHDAKFDTRLAYSCASLWFYVFGVFILAVEATSTLFFLLLLSAPMLTYYGVMKFAIPRPDDALVKEILGREVEPEEDGSQHISDGGDCKDENAGVIMSVIAHRFAGLDAPENTMEALELCHTNGAIGAEFDLVLTKDLVPIIFHDYDLDRLSLSTGEVKEKTWDELQKVDVSVKHPFHEKFQGCKIPLFEDVIKKVIDYDMRIFIDIKDDRPEITNVIIDIYKKYPVLYTRAICSSFNFFIVYGIRKRDPSIVVSMAWRPHYMSFCTYSPKVVDCIPYSNSPIIYYYSRILDHLTTWFFNNLAFYLVGFSAVLIAKDVITPEYIKFWREKNVRVIAWTVNKPLEKLHCTRNLGITYMTDSMIGS